MKQKSLAALILSTGLMLSACNMPEASAPNGNALSTAAAKTVQAVLSPAATQVPLATATVIAGPDITCVDTANYTAWTRDGVLYDVKELEKPLAPGQVFTMSWTIQNNGACTWTDVYQMTFDSGTQLTQATQFPVIPTGSTVAPGGTFTVNIPMTAPDAVGSYETVFQLKNGYGEDVINLGVTTKVGTASTTSLAAPGDLKYAYDCTTGTVNISLTWVDKANNEDGYRIYRDGTKLTDVPAGSTAYSDIAPSSGKFAYTVAAFNASGESPTQVRVDTPNCQ